MNEYYFAPVYDFLLQPFIHHMRKQVVHTAQKYRAEKVIDMCCGTGHQLRYLQRAGINASGVDLNPMMLQQAQKKNASSCQEADARNTSFPARHFHLSMTTLSLHEMPINNAREVVAEMIRLTRPGGQIMLIDYDFGPRSSPLMKQALKAVEFFVGGEHYRNFRRYLASGQMENLTAGFSLKLLETHHFFLRTAAMRIYETPDTGG
jgi:ubiquinone/menaquinone biosynthesis C-methylase UbiE